MWDAAGHVFFFEDVGGFGEDLQVIRQLVEGGEVDRDEGIELAEAGVGIAVGIHLLAAVAGVGVALVHIGDDGVGAEFLELEPGGEADLDFGDVGHLLTVFAGSEDAFRIFAGHVAVDLLDSSLVDHELVILLLALGLQSEVGTKRHAQQRRRSESRPDVLGFAIRRGVRLPAVPVVQATPQPVVPVAVGLAAGVAFGITDKMLTERNEAQKAAKADPKTAA